MANQDHIIMFPFMAQGHIIPFLALAKLIIQRKPTIKITLVSTPLNIRYLQSTLNSSSSETTNIHNQIYLSELPFNGSGHGLPPNSENTDALPSHLIKNLFFASDTLKPSFENLVSDIIRTDQRVPLCIISDIFIGWAVDVAKNVGTSHFAFTTGGGYGTAVYFSLYLYLPHRNSTGIIEEFHLPKFPETCRLHSSQLPKYLREADSNDPFAKHLKKHVSFSLKSDGILCNSVEEIEILGHEVLRNYINPHPVWTIGPLIPPFLLTQKSEVNSANSSTVSHLRTGKEFGISPESCIEWLDFQQPSSVLYISFGSQNTISASQMMGLALGVEESGKPFIWVLRPPGEFDIKSEFQSQWLPEGFEDRIKESKRGLLVKKWAPQLEILCHKSTGVFLSHCGWNSVMESLSQGVPIIGWPLAAEQAYNSKMLEEEMGVCVELARGVEGKIVSGEVKRVIEEVMSKEGKGGEMKRKASVIGKKIRAAVREEGDEKGSSVRALDDFLETLLASKRG